MTPKIEYYPTYLNSAYPNYVKTTQSTVLPVPTRHRRHACIKMRTALPANTKTRPNVVSMLKQHWVKCSRLLGSTQVSVYTHPSPTIIFSPADQGTFSKTAGQSQAYYNTWNWERGTYDVNHLHILTCEGAVSRVSSVCKNKREKILHSNVEQCFIFQSGYIIHKFSKKSCNILWFKNRYLDLYITNLNTTQFKHIHIWV